MQRIHIALLVFGGLATGLPQLQYAFPPKATAYLLGAASVCALVATIIGGISNKIGSGDAPKA